MTLSQSLPPVPGLAAQIHESSRQDADIAASVDVPVSADFMSGYGLEPEDVAESVTRCVATGVAGLSIEDATGDPTAPLYDLSIAVERVRAARMAIDRSGADVLLTARGFIRAAQILREGSFAGLPNLVPYIQMNELFTNELA
jgi:2-methylisocitrate lyase-like PEP mutase family enzyme